MLKESKPSLERLATSGQHWRRCNEWSVMHSILQEIGFQAH